VTDRRFCTLAAAMMALLVASPAAAGEAIKVAATIAPVHSLAAMVTDGIVEPDLIVRPGASPHSYAMKPSEARALDRADVVFWVGEMLEPWMVKAIGTLAGDAVVVELAAVGGLNRLGRRAGGVWEAHDHHDDDEAHTEPDQEGHENVDPHLWLAPDNARIWLDAMAAALAGADPDNARTYKANAAKAAEKLTTLALDIEELLTPVRGKPYVVFHDAYQYFERRFDLQPVGSISLGDADRPGPARIVDIRAEIAESHAVCVFAEPQFEPKLVDTVIEGMPVEKGTLDPIGAGLQPGPDLYPALLEGLATALADCLG
jgi:zinc transport system substrate-binding protein